jgi:hypothetical protein
MNNITILWLFKKFKSEKRTEKKNWILLTMCRNCPFLKIRSSSAPSLTNPACGCRLIVVVAGWRVPGG